MTTDSEAGSQKKLKVKAEADEDKDKEKLAQPEAEVEVKKEMPADAARGAGAGQKPEGSEFKPPLAWPPMAPPPPKAKALGQERPVTPPKSPPAKQEKQAVKAEDNAEEDKKFALNDLKQVVTSLGALDACLMHFSSKASTPRDTEQRDDAQDAAGAADPGAAGEEVDWGDDEEAEEEKTQETSWNDLAVSMPVWRRFSA